MSFALITTQPFAIVKLLQGETPPEPLLWPDGAATHGVSVPLVHGEWALVPYVYEPAQPSEFYQLASTSPSFDGARVTFLQDWQPLPLDHVKRTLMDRIDAAAEASRLKYITPGAGQALTYQQKFTEAQAFAAAKNPVAGDYPLLNATVGIGGRTIDDVCSAVLAAAAKWSATAAVVENIRMSTKAAIANAADLESAVAAHGMAAWP